MTSEIESDVVLRSEGHPGHTFGAAVAASGDRLLVGAPSRDYAYAHNESVPPPSASLFRRAGERWERA